MNLIDNLKDLLRKGIVTFTYRKVDGSTRNARGTLVGVGHTIKGTGHAHKSEMTIQYYDVDCKGWRSFRSANLIEVGKLTKGTPQEHHEICLALVVKLKKAMQNNNTIAFAYRKVDGSIRYAHGTLCDNGFDENDKYFSYFDTDKKEVRKFRIDAFLGFGEKNEVADYLDNYDQPSTECYGDKSYTSFSEINLRTILAKKGIDLDDTEDILVIDLLPYLNKEQLTDLIITATKRLAEI